MEWFVYSLLFVIAVLMSITAVYAFNWALKNGHLRNFDAQAKSIFDETEPMGVQTDFFPGKGPRNAGASKPVVSQNS